MNTGKTEMFDRIREGGETNGGLENRTIGSRLILEGMTRFLRALAAS